MNPISRYLAFCLSILFGITSVHSTPTDSPTKPNFVLIFVDDLGYADLEYHGVRTIPTPHINRMAREGILSTSAYASAPQCGPSRAGLLTGIYQNRFGFEYNGLNESPTYGIPTDKRLIGDYLKDAGYHTGMVGKWHMGTAPQFHPQKRGFDEFFGFLGGGHDYLKTDPDAPAHVYTTLLTDFDGNRVGFEGYLTDVLADKASDFIKRNKAKLFFLYLALNTPHSPMQCPERYAPDDEEDIEGIYEGMIRATDDAVGTVLKAIEDNQIQDNTLVIFTNDNGGPGNKYPTLNTPFSGHKGDLLEGGIRVPWIWHWPGKLQPGVSSTPIITLDLIPTFLDLASHEISPELDGESLWNLLSGTETDLDTRNLYWRWDFRGTKQAAIRRGNWKYYDGHPRSQLTGGKHDQYLFDLDNDPSESKNLIQKHPKLAQELATLLEDWKTTLAPPAWPYIIR